LPAETGPDPVAEARRAAAAAGTLAELAAAIAAFPHCALKRGARSTVVHDGRPDARVLILGEAPGAEEDRAGRPFVGRAGQLLDRMFAAIGLSRDHPDPGRALCITNTVFWRPPGNRDPEPAEIAMLSPFVARLVDLAAPEVLVLMGNIPLIAGTGAGGILRARGRWTTAFGRPALPMTHPAYLLRNPRAKREAWADLLALQARLAGAAP
jgi:DNA polymerase